MPSNRITAGFGLLYLVAVFTALAVAPLPDFGASHSEVARVASTLRMSNVLPGAYLQIVAYTALLCFFVRLSASASAERLALVTGAFTSALASIAVAAGLLISAALDHADGPGASAVLAGASALTWVSTTGFGFGLLTAGATALSTRELPRWLSWSAIVVGAALAVTLLFAASPVRDLPPTLADVWILAVAILLLIRRRADAARPSGGERVSVQSGA
jgi:hypothetical protein